MTLTILDWLVIAAYFLFNLGIAIYYSRRARGSTSEFFLSGRDVPWWLAGTSMVATTFAADTPLAVTGFVARNGIAGNWLWWNFVMSGMMTVFLYARLWRRAGVMTDVEFAELRYSGKPAAFLRGFRALYLGLPINCIILGWVNLAMIKILVTLGLSELNATYVLIGMLIFTAFYTTLSGLWGVLVTDLFQFVLKMGMVILLAVLAVRAVGGIDALKLRIVALDAATGQPGSRLAFFPALDSIWMPTITLFVYLSVNWWASWYPGAEPGGGGYVAQRIFSAKDERHGLLATLWFNVAHYALRPWPWILTALASLVLYPDLVDKESGYIRTLMDPNIFPPYLRGFMLAAFAAAYMSTIGTQLNWGASYIINDFYRRFAVRRGSESHYVIASQIVTVLLMAISLVVTFNLGSIGGAWKLLLVTGAGTGTVLLLRWFWWRINAWSEVSAMVVAAVVSLFLQVYLKWDSDQPRDFAYLMLVTVGITTLAWLAVTMFTAPEPREKLIAFYRRVQPEGPGWTSIAAEVGAVENVSGGLAMQFVNWALGCVLIYASLFGIGKLVFKEWAAAAGFTAVAGAAALLISRNMSQVWESSMKKKSHVIVAVLSIVLISVPGVRAQTVAPSSVGMSSQQLSHIDEAVHAEIAGKQLPGAVVVVGRQGKIVFRRAYGNRALEPQVEPMTVDTVFDLASLTKVVSTATSVMVLVERGQVRLGDPVARYIPEFAAAGKRGITVEQLLTHRSGFTPDNDLKDYEQGPEKAFENIWNLAPIAETGSRFIYSDVNYIVLAELVKRVSGKAVDEFAAENIFRPLGMKDTGFKPSAGLHARIAPTEKRDDRWMRGEVHDPRAYLLGGVAGHAGLFSSADDLAVYCQMILNRGEYRGTRVLSPMGVTRMTEARPSGGNAGDGSARGIGWDVVTSYSANRGDLFPLGSFGHTGFTGGSLWIDPASETFVVFLSNRVHPRLDPKEPADVTSLRGRIASIVAASIVAPPYSKQSPVVVNVPGAAPRSAMPPALNGVDALARNGFSVLKGRRIGLITNQTGRDRDGHSTIDLLKGAPGVTLVSLFSPEHGIRGVADDKVSDSIDDRTGLPIHSLYGETRKPTSDMLKGIDTLVYDIQDVGARFYTYISTLGLAMEEAARNNISFVVLDRVNPIGGADIDGPLADRDKLSFTAYHPIPVRHGMTVGELAQLFNRERGINADLQVVRVENWRRDEWFDETGLTWINPSPNMRSLTEAILYPGIALLETTNVSVGRGTDTPFEVIGAPWIDARQLAATLNTAGLRGVRFIPVRFTPNASTHKGVECAGVNIIITDRTPFEPLITGLEVAVQLLKLYPKDFAADKLDRLLANQKVFDSFLRGSDARALRQIWEGELGAFRSIRSKYLLY